jgi:mRNA interferase MazF
MGGRGRRAFLSVKRGDIHTAAARGAYTGKPRPVVILQDDRFDATTSVTVCPFTTNPVEAPLVRLPVDPSEENGLDQPSRLMVDKVTTVPRSSLGERLGRLRDDELVSLNRSLTVFLGLASGAQT